MMDHESVSQWDIEKQTKLPSSATKDRYTKKSPGRYLKEKTPAPRRGKRRRRKLNPRFVIMLAVVLALLIGIAFGVRSCLAKPKIIGRWNLDGTTVYEFKKGGKGTLILLTGDYEFTYEIQDSVIHIDFADEGALDSRYTYDVDGKMLLLIGGPGDSTAEYILYKMK